MKRVEWAKDVFPWHVSIIFLLPFKNRKHFQVLLELYTYFLRNYCYGILHRNTSKKCYRCHTSSPRHAGTGAKAKQWNFNRLTVFQIELQQTDLRRFTIAIPTSKMISRDFWLQCTKRGCQNSLALWSTWHWQNRCRPQKCIIGNNTQVGTSASCRIPDSWPFATMRPWNSLDMECI